MEHLDELLTFAQVVDAGSFAATARRQRSTRAAVAKQIARLEDELGVRLLERSTRRMRPTEVGRRILAHADRIARETREVEALAEGSRAEVSGLLRISAVKHFGRVHVTPVVLELLCAHPALSIELSLDDRMVDLIAGGFDVAVRIGWPEDSSLVARRISEVELAICAAPSYLAAAGTPTHPRQLGAHQCVLYSSPEVHVASWSYYEPDGELASVTVSGRLALNDGDRVLDAVLAGAGVALLPRFLADEALAAGTLVELFHTLRLPTYAPIQAIYPARQHLPPKTRYFIDALVARIAKLPSRDNLTDVHAGILGQPGGAHRLWSSAPKIG